MKLHQNHMDHACTDLRLLLLHTLCVHSTIVTSLVFDVLFYVNVTLYIYITHDTSIHMLTLLNFHCLCLLFCTTHTQHQERCVSYTGILYTIN
jgi:hypothetical protein